MHILDLGFPESNARRDAFMGEQSLLRGRPEEGIRVLIWGFGAIGSGIAGVLLEKQGVSITGVCDNHPHRIGRSIYTLLGIDPGSRPDVTVYERIEDVIDAPQFPGAELALVATDSFVSGTFEKIKLLAEHGINVISTAEEMVYPWAGAPQLAEQLDEVARRNGVSILGAGINPGFIMDLFAVVLSGACRRVERIDVRRINSLSEYGETVMSEQGVGLTPEEFRRRAADGSIAGHVGFRESIALICTALGWKLDGPITQSMNPIVSEVRRESRYTGIAAGTVAGCDMRAVGSIDGEQRIFLEHPQQIEPQAEGVDTGDYITIVGEPNIELRIVPEVPGGVGTAAICVNMIPQVINAPPGLKTMLDLPVPRAIMGDMRDQLEPESHAI